MDENKATVITADYMYLVFVGSQEILKKISNKLNNIQKKNFYIIHNIDVPCINLVEDKTVLNTFKNNYLILDEGIEMAQCLVYAEYQKQNVSIMMSISKTEINNVISFPILQIDDEENPEKIISLWLKKYNIDKIIDSITIKPIELLEILMIF